MLLIILFLTTILPGNIHGFEVGSGLGSGDEVSADSCKLPNGVFPDPDSCKVFIRCQSGEPEVELCSDGLLFNPFKMTCDFSKTGNCSEPNDFEPPSKIETDDVACSEDGPNIYSIQSSCTEYYVCENNTAFKVKCSDGLLMNSEMLTCDLPENVECDIVSSTEESTVEIKAIYGNDKEEPEIDSTLSDINESSAQSAETTAEINSETVYDKTVSEGPDRNLRTISDVTESDLPDSSLSNSEGTIEVNVTKTSLRANFTDVSTSKPGLDQTTNVVLTSTMPVKNKSISSISVAETKNFEISTTEINKNYVETSSPVTGTILPFKPFDDNDSSGSLEQNITSDEDETTIQTSNKDATKVNSGSDVDIIDIFTTPSHNESQMLTQENKFTDASSSDFKIVSTTLNDKNNVFTKSSDDETWTSDTFSKTLDSEIETVYSTNLSTDATKIMTQTTKSEFLPEDYELTSQTDTPNDTTIFEFDLTTIGQNSKSTTSNFASISETLVDKENESNLQITTQSHTTFIENDNKITPERTLGTTQSLMSSDPLTDNETSKYTTSTYSETKISPSHFIETTTATVQNFSNTETAQTNTSTLHSETTERDETSTKVFTENDSLSESTNDFPPETFVSGESSLDFLSTDISRKISTVNATFDENFEKPSTTSRDFLSTSASESETVSNFITEDATVGTITLSKYTSEHATETQNFISSENESLAQTDDATSSDTHFDKILSSTSNWDANETSNSYFFNSTVTNKILDKNETSMETFEEDNYTTPTRTSEYFDAYSTASETQMNESSKIFEDSTTEGQTLITGSQSNSVSEIVESLVSTEKSKASSTINLSNLNETSNFRNSTTMETSDFTETSKNDFPLLTSSTYIENVTNSNPQITNSDLISTLTHEIKPHTETFQTTNTSKFGLTTVISLDNQTDHVDKGDTDSLLTSDLDGSEKFTEKTETISNTKHSEETQTEITMPFSRTDLISTGDPSLHYSSQMTSVRDSEELTTQNSESTDDFERKTPSTVHVTNLEYVSFTETDGSPNSSFETPNNDNLASTLPNEISETNLNTTTSTTVSVDNTDNHINTMSSENKINFETTSDLLKTETVAQSEPTLKSTNTAKTYSLHTSTTENVEEAYKTTDISNNKHESSKPNFVTDSVHNTTITDYTTVREILKTDNQKDSIFDLTTTQKDFTVSSKITEIPPISTLDLNSNETSNSGFTKDAETELFTDNLETERVTSAQSLDLTNPENMLETSPYSEISKNENDYSKNASVSNNGQSTTTGGTYFTNSQEASTSESSHTSEYGHTVKVSSEMEITNEILDPFSPKTEYFTAIENLTSKVDTAVASTLVSNSLIQNITSSDTVTNKMTDLVHETNEMLSTVSDANHSFESTFSIPISSKQADKSSSLELVTSEISTLTDLTDVTLPHKYVNDSVTDINSTTDEIESQSETMGDIAETSSTVVSPTTFPSNENITFNPIKYETDAKEILMTSTSEYKTSAKDAVSSTTEFITTKFSTENINTSETSRITGRNFDKSTLSTQPNFDISSSVTSSIDLNTEGDTVFQTTSSFTSENIISDFNSSHIATQSTKIISDSTQTIKYETSKPGTTHENKLFPSPDSLVSQPDLLEKSTPNSSEGTNETASNGITEKFKSTTDVSPSINELYSKDTDLSTLDTTKEIHSSASTFTIPVTKEFFTKTETNVRYEDRTESTDSFSKSESSSEYTEIFSTEYSRKSTNRKPLTESLVTDITGSENSPTATSRIYKTTDIFDDVSESSKSNTDSSTIGETIPENTKETEYVSSTTHSAIAETSVTTRLPKDISENNIHTVSTTKILYILNNDTTETTEMNFDYLNVSITSRNLEEKTDENTEQPSIGSFPVSLLTETTDSSSSTITEKEHNGKILIDDEISTIKTTLNPICVSSEGNFPFPGDCNQFFQCINGIPQISSCVGDEHFDPVKRICTDPCLAKCDPNADCGTTESTTNGVDLTSVNTFSTTDSDSTETSMDYTTEKVPFTKETTLDKLSTLTSEKTSTAAISVSQSTLETTFRENWTDQLTSLGLSSSVADMNVTNDPTETIWNDFTTSTSTEKSTTELDLSSTSTDVAITSTTENQEITTEKQTEMSRMTTFSPEETSKETVYESSVTPRSTADIKSTSDWNGSGEDEISTSSSWSTLTKCENGECSSDLPTSATVMPLRLCKRNDFLSQPNCNEYLDCTNDVPIKLECPNGLHFNPTTRVCDWPYKAECGMLPKPLFEPTNLITCPCKSCLLPSTTSCSEYYLCLGYTAYKMNCSASLNFDRSRNTCNYAPLVDCNNLISSSPSATETTEGYTKTSTKEITTSTTKSTASQFVCPSREGLFRYPGNCEMFYQCSNWYPYTMRCAATTHFSEITQRCEYPCDAKCDLTLNCGSPSTAPPSDPRCSCINCKLPSSESCTKYIVCVKGKARIEYCPWGQTFDVKRSTCDWAHKVACHHSAICPERNGIFPHKDDCRKFVHCSNGIPYTKKCPHTLEFDPVKKRCEWPSGRCNDLPLSKELDISKRGEEKRKGWRCPKTFGYFSHEKYCNKFYHCSFGTPALKECPPGLLYNSRYQTCDWEKKVRCNANRHQKPRRCRVYDHHAVCPDNRIPLPHILCNMYYDCTAGRACAKQCPIGLYFNNATGLCDLPENVMCFNPGKEEYSLKELSYKCDSGFEGRIVNPTNDACFYHCRHGKVVSGCCSKGQIYNFHKDKCERRTLYFKI